MWYNFFTAPGSLSDEKNDVEYKEHLLWNIANIVAFSSIRNYETKYCPLKDLHCTQNFSSFYLKMCKLIIKNCFVKIKIELDFILSEITFDDGIGKRWETYFLKSLHVFSKDTKDIPLKTALKTFTIRTFF